MTRQKFLALFPAALLALVMLCTMAPQRAMAQQNPNCCSYSVEITGISPKCFPFELRTEWSSGVSDLITYTANGVYWNPIPGPCPRAPKFSWTALGFSGSPAGLGETEIFFLNGCCYQVTVTLHSNGCILIRISPYAPC